MVSELLGDSLTAIPLQSLAAIGPRIEKLWIKHVFAQAPLVARKASQPQCATLNTKTAPLTDALLP